MPTALLVTWDCDIGDCSLTGGGFRVDITGNACMSGAYDLGATSALRPGNRMPSEATDLDAYVVRCSGGPRNSWKAALLQHPAIPSMSARQTNSDCPLPTLNDTLLSSTAEQGFSPPRQTPLSLWNRESQTRTSRTVPPETLATPFMTPTQTDGPLSCTLPLPPPRRY